MQMIQRRGAVVLTAVLLAMAVLAGCEDECKKGETECINSELIRTCVPTADDPEWLITECPEHSVCVKDAAGDGADAGAGAASGDMCVGKCDLGEHECVSDALARVCIEGGIWQLDACEVGEKCTDGVCGVGGGPGSVQACVPDTKQCASDMVEKICDPDGTAWIQQPCALNEHCVDTECVPDTTASCDDGNVCLDAKTAVRCLGQDEGFELVPCEGDTYCEFGRCRGPQCVVGSVCSGPFSGITGLPSQVRTCADGTGFEDTQCGVNEVCKQDKDWASCVPNICVPGATQCGDPRDPTVDPKKFFTTCVGGGSTSSLVPEWVQGECAGELICDPTAVGAGTPCRRTCTPGAQQCAADSALGTSSGVQTCADDGTWLATETCHTGVEALKTCLVSPNPDASALPVAVCGEPVCARVFSAAGVLAGLEGTCDEDGKLRRCNPDGTLGDPEDCLQGVCANGGAEAIQGDGRIAGACQVTPQCQEGDERCVWVGGFTPTPQFQSCVNGFWSTHLQTCPNDGLCYPTKTAENRPGKLCGAECSPGGHSCIPDPDNVGEMLLTTCGDNGQYDNGQPCAAGVCANLTNNDAACVMQCIPGQVTCGGLAVTAPDGVHTGTASVATCAADGTLEVATACAAGTACRTSSTGVVVGCVECIGPSVPGGNAEGVNDSTCDVATATTILECDGNNELTPRTCDGGKVCAGATPSTCGLCSDGVGLGGNFVTCTQTNLVAAQVCGPCTIDTDGSNGALTANLPSCTETAMAAAVVTGGTPTCNVQGYGVATAWAGETDCCSAVVDGLASCQAGGYGLPTAVAGAADCCSTAVIAGGGGTFAYCEAP